MKVDEVTGVVLAGGQSKRMGADKASLVLGGKPMIAHAIDRLREVLPEVVVVAKDACRLDVPGVKVIADAAPDVAGALVGIYSALLAVKTPYAFVVACDMPYIRPELVRRMIEACHGCDAFVPRIGAAIEPLFALYSRACLPSIEKRLDAGDLRVRGFFEDVNTAYAEEQFLREADPGLSSFVNINTREDLENARLVMGADVTEAEAGSYRIVKITKFKDVGEDAETVSESEDAVIAEIEITVLLNGKPVCGLQCCPHGLESLVAGHLLSDGYIRPGQRILEVIAHRGASTAVDVKVEEVGEGSGPGEVAPPVAAGLEVTPGRVCESIEELLKKSPLFGLTGAAHAAALCSGSGMVYWSEDISRHNAVDRVAGQCLLAGDSFADKFLVITGRINSEMAEKAAVCGIGLVASKAPPTDKGVELAEKLGVTVVGFVRNRRFNVYSHPQRLLAGRDSCISRSWRGER